LVFVLKIGRMPIFRNSYIYKKAPDGAFFVTVLVAGAGFEPDEKD